MGHDLSLHAKHGNRAFDFGNWQQTRCGLFRDFAKKFEEEAEKSVQVTAYCDVDYWRPRDFAMARRWLTDQSTQDTYIAEEFKDLATALMIMEFDHDLWFHSSW